MPCCGHVGGEGKRKPEIVFHLQQGTRRLGGLRRLFPGMTRRMLTKPCTSLGAPGRCTGRPTGRCAPKVEHSLTIFGRTLEPVLEPMCEWGERYAGRRFLPGAESSGGVPYCAARLL